MPSPRGTPGAGLEPYPVGEGGDGGRPECEALLSEQVVGAALGRGDFGAADGPDSDGASSGIACVAMAALTDGRVLLVRKARAFVAAEVLRSAMLARFANSAVRCKFCA